MEPDRARQIADAHNLDAIVPLTTDNDDHRLSKIPGMRWLGLKGAGPFHSNPNFTEAGYTETALSVRWLLLERGPQTTYAYKYNEDDPLRNLLVAIQGSVPEAGEPYLSGMPGWYHQFESRPETEVLRITSMPSAIELTTDGLVNKCNDGRSAIVSLNPENIEHLVTFWNLRATGVNVFAWPATNGARFAVLLQSWLSEWLGKTKIESSGEQDRSIEVLRLDAHTEGSQLLFDILHDLNLRAQETKRGMYSYELYANPISSEYRREFTTVGTDRFGYFAARMPRVISSALRRHDQLDGVVAADIHISSDHYLPVGTTFLAPNIRNITSISTASGMALETFRRPIYSGISVGAMSDSTDVHFRSYRSLAFFAELLKHDNAAVEQSDSGIFASHLISKLGGPFSNFANQPAFRAVLSTASTSPLGVPIARLITAAAKYRGEWPQNAYWLKQYPKDVVYQVLARDLLRPHLAIKCPQCLNESAVRPSDLDFKASCDFCAADFTLGLALATDQRSRWVYQLAGNIAPARLAETLPIMACINLLQSIPRSTDQITPATVVGLKISSPTLKCEIDVASFVSDAANPVIVIGEVKSYRDSLTLTDVKNLRAVQSWFLKLGVRCVVMLATLREKLADDEVEMLQSEYTQLSIVQHLTHRSYPDLPLVFVADDLSTDILSPNHPTKWRKGSRLLMEDYALESCKRNLGLTEVKFNKSVGHAVASYNAGPTAGNPT
jgi:hypothetical protein